MPNLTSVPAHVHSEASDVTLPVAELMKHDVSVSNGVLTVKNAELANLIHSKLAMAAPMTAARPAAAEVDVSVSVKVRF